MRDLSYLLLNDPPYVTADAKRLAAKMRKIKQLDIFTGGARPSEELDAIVRYVVMFWIFFLLMYGLGAGQAGMILIVLPICLYVVFDAFETCFLLWRLGGWGKAVMQVSTVEQVDRWNTNVNSFMRDSGGMEHLMVLDYLKETRAVLLVQFERTDKALHPELYPVEGTTT